MIYVGIDVAKDKHDCCIMNAEGEQISNVFRITNDYKGFMQLVEKIRTAEPDPAKVKVGLEATGHYSHNILGFLLDEGLTTYVINPLHSNLFRKSLSLRKTKTDRVDAKAIATMLHSGVVLESYSSTLYHNDQLKSLTRYRFNKVRERSTLKVSMSRLVNIMFPELEALVSSIHGTAVYKLLFEVPDVKLIASMHLTRLTNLLLKASNNQFGREKALAIRAAARESIGRSTPAHALELRHTIRLICELNNEIREIESAIEQIIFEMNPPILSIPGIGPETAAMIIAEIGDFSRFSSPDKLLAYAGMAPGVYQSGQMYSTHSHMEKRGSHYLRYALFTAAGCVCRFDPVFKDYLTRKRSEGKHYLVAISHAAKKLVRVIFALMKSGKPFVSAQPPAIPFGT